jgi:hypothetical protein
MAVICRVCGNEKTELREKVYIGMGEWKSKLSGKYSCGYCAWKGTSGPGKQLRQIVKSHNNEVIR